MAAKELRQNGMMNHLLTALEKGKDIGHYGRLVLVMVARHFMSDEELTKVLVKNPKFDEVQAKALIEQVRSRGYNPPRREKIRQWQKEQDFPICPDGDNPDACNLYRDLKFPDGVYEDIQHYHEQKATA